MRQTKNLTLTTLPATEIRSLIFNVEIVLLLEKKNNQEKAFCAY